MASAMVEIWEPMFPKPMIPSFFPHLPGVFGRFIPYALMGAVHFVVQPSQQHNDFGDDQFRDAPRVAERGIEYGHPFQRGRLEVHLVRPDAERPHRQEVGRTLENVPGHLGPRSDAEQRHAFEGTNEIAGRRLPDRVRTSKPAPVRTSSALGCTFSARRAFMIAMQAIVGFVIFVSNSISYPGQKSN